jgi:hypothetical protein
MKIVNWELGIGESHQPEACWKSILSTEAVGRMGTLNFDF